LSGDVRLVSVRVRFEVRLSDTSKLSHIVGSDDVIFVSFIFVRVRNLSLRGLRNDVRWDGNVDALKLSHVVGSSTNLESTNARTPSKTTAKRTGMMIWNIVTTTRRFCSSQFFHSNSQNCARFEIAILVSDTALKRTPQLQTSQHTIMKHATSFSTCIGLLASASYINPKPQIGHSLFSRENLCLKKMKPTLQSN